MLKKTSKILFLTQAYPHNDNRYNMAFVHTRCLEYVQMGVDLDVLSFSAEGDYKYEGVSVFTEKSVDINSYDIIVSHAPNVRNHFRYILKKRIFGKVVFVIHGHEFLNVVRYYPGRYDGLKYPWWRSFLEFIKLNLLNFYFLIFKHSKMIFVSDWMKTNAEICIPSLKASSISSTIVPNPCHKLFVDTEWQKHTPKIYDFITIRPLSEKKYAVDIVVNIALAFPEKSFAVVGTGDIFNHIEKPLNIEHLDFFLKQSDIPDYLNKAQVALMPTRLDAQGVMMCEMASFGIPLVTSDLEVCREMLDGFENVQFLDNNNPTKNFMQYVQSLSNKQLSEENRFKFDKAQLARKELGFIYSEIQCF